MPYSFYPRLSLGLMAIIWLASLMPGWAYEMDALNINVKSTVEDLAKQTGLLAPNESKRTQTYFLGPPLEEPSVYELIKPVDPKMIERETHKVLQTQGYRPAVMGEIPDMSITVLYGRGYIRNPYPSPGDLLGWSVQDVKDLEESGAYVPFSNVLAGKREAADQEKLFIIVGAWAWDVPAMIKRKAKRLWRTVIHIDDPDHRDLNQIAPVMFATGADFFGRKSKGPVVEITKPLPAGQITIGPMRELEAPTDQTGGLPVNH